MSACPIVSTGPTLEANTHVQITLFFETPCIFKVFFLKHLQYIMYYVPKEPETRVVTDPFSWGTGAWCPLQSPPARYSSVRVQGLK